MMQVQDKNWEPCPKCGGKLGLAYNATFKRMQCFDFGWGCDYTAPPTAEEIPFSDADEDARQQALTDAGVPELTGWISSTDQTEKTICKCLCCGTHSMLQIAGDASAWDCPHCRAHYDLNNAPKCSACGTVTMLHPQITDGYPYWCYDCSEWYSVTGEKQRDDLPASDCSAPVSQPMPASSGKISDHLNAVAAAALVLFTMPEWGYVPTDHSENALRDALKNLIRAGWKP